MVQLSIIDEQVIEITIKDDKKEVARGKRWKNENFSHNLVMLET